MTGPATADTVLHVGGASPYDGAAGAGAEGAEGSAGGGVVGSVP